MKTHVSKEKDFVSKTYLMDANGKTLGRLATRIAGILIGKNKTNYAPDKLCGDQVVVINAEKVHITGRKASSKLYTHFTGYPDGLRSFVYEDLIQKKPTEIIHRAVARMVPNTKLGRKMMTRLRVYAGDKHEQQAQKPIQVA